MSNESKIHNEETRINGILDALAAVKDNGAEAMFEAPSWVARIAESLRIPFLAIELVTGSTVDLQDIDDLQGNEAALRVLRRRFAKTPLEIDHE